MDSNNAIILLQGGWVGECSAEFNDIMMNLSHLIAQERKSESENIEDIKTKLRDKSWILIDPGLEVDNIRKDQYGGLRVLDELIGEGLSPDKKKPRFIVLSLDSSETFFNKRFVGRNLFREQKYSRLCGDTHDVFYLKMPFEIGRLEDILLDRDEAYFQCWTRYFRESRFKSLFSPNLPFTIALLDDEPKDVEKALQEAFNEIKVKLTKDEGELLSDPSYQALLKVFNKTQCQEFRNGRESNELQDHDIDLYLVDLFFQEESGAQEGRHPQDVSARDPRMMGFELIEKIRRVREDAKIVALTRFKQEDKIIESIRRGANWFVEKEQAQNGLSVDNLIPVICNLYDEEAQREWERKDIGSGPDKRIDKKIDDRSGWINSLKEKEKEAKLKILSGLFRDFERITIIDRVKGGLSGGDTLFVQPERWRDGTSDPQTVKAVKIGERFELFYEKRHYEEIIDGYLDSFIGRVKGEMVQEADFAGIMYTSVGTSENYKERSLYPSPLKDYIKRKVKEGAEKELEDSVEKFLDTLLKPLHGTPRKKKLHEEKNTILDFYWEVLPAWWRTKPENCDKKQVEKLLNDPRGRKGKKVNLKLENIQIGHDDGYLSLYEVNKLKKEIKLCLNASPGKKKIDVFMKEEDVTILRIEDFLKDTLEKRVFVHPLPEIRELKRIGSPLECLRTTVDYDDEIHFSRIHGDFNLGNVLLTFDKEDKVDNYWLIDFSKTKEESHTAFDFTKLELEIRTQILADLLGRLIQEKLIEKALPETELYKEVLLSVYEIETGKELSDKIVADPVKRLYRVIGKIRQMAIHEWGLSPKEYFLSLYLYSISALKFKNLRDKNINRYAPLPAAIAYVTAAGCARRLKESFGLWGDE